MKPWPADHVERRPVAELVPDARNARTHSEAQIAQIAASIREWGWTIPVLVDEEGGIIAGHGRVLAAYKLDLKDVPTMTARGWSEAQKRAYIIADNKLAENADWDRDLLRVELGALGEAGFNLDLIGFSEVEMTGLLLDREFGENDPEAEWAGMPEFDQRDKTAFRTLPVHFKDQEALDEFAKLIGQTITPQTRFIWFPETVIERYVDKRWQTGPEPEAAEG